MTCIYCNGERGVVPMTIEHIWPQALGGALSPNLFQNSEVCSICNSLAGLWVDGAFLKSWFISHEGAAAARQFLDPTKPGTMPLAYMGIYQGFPTQSGEVAELWMGPSGDSIYHVHLADEDKWYGYAGGDIIKRKKDFGRAYFVLRSPNQYWAATSLNSFLTQMKGARLFTVTKFEGLHENTQKLLTMESEADEIEKSEINWIRTGRTNDNHHIEFSVRIDSSRRFLAKLALGLGANLFGCEYLNSDYAGELRKVLWNKQSSDEDEPRIFGSDYFYQERVNEHEHLNGIYGAWSIILASMDDSFGVTIWTPGGRCLAITISDENRFWSDAGFEPYHLGQYYFVVPQRKYFSPPVSIVNFAMHKAGAKFDPIISHVEGMRTNTSQLPPLS